MRATCLPLFTESWTPACSRPFSPASLCQTHILLQMPLPNSTRLRASQVIPRDFCLNLVFELTPVRRDAWMHPRDDTHPASLVQPPYTAPQCNPHPPEDCQDVDAPSSFLPAGAQGSVAPQCPPRPRTAHQARHCRRHQVHSFLGLSLLNVPKFCIFL